MTIALWQRPLARVVAGIVRANDGALFDPSDLSTLYQDAAGTTPVTAVEQPVGLMLDKSQGLMLGPELVSNGTFDADTTGWTAKKASIAAVNGELAVTNTAGELDEQAEYALADLVTPNTFYKITFSGRSGSATQPAMFLLETESITISQIVFTSQNKYSVILKIPASFVKVTARFRTQGAAGGVSYFDNISIKELYGYHATQSVTASRPTLSARYNLLTKTEDFSDATWIKQYLAVSARITHASGVLVNVLTEDTTNNLHYMREGTTVVPGNTYKYICILGKKERKYAALYASTPGVGVVFDLESRSFFSNLISAPLSYSIRDLGNGLCECSISYVATSTSTAPAVYICNETGQYTYIGDGVSGIYVARAELRDVASFLPYQRVNTATDYDTDERYFPKYLRFDGVDDYLNLPYMGLYANGSASVVASLIKSPGSADTYAVGEGNSSDADTRYGLVRLSTSGVSASSFIRADDATTLLSSSGTSISTINPNVVSVLDNSTSVRYKSAAADTTESYVRSATLTVNTTTIGALASTAIVGYSRMNLYGLIITKSALTDAQRIKCERFLARKAGVML